jgi:hypothetical protein
MIWQGICSFPNKSSFELSLVLEEPGPELKWNACLGWILYRFLTPPRLGRGLGRGTSGQLPAIIFINLSRMLFTTAGQRRGGKIKVSLPIISTG